MKLPKKILGLVLALGLLLTTVVPVLADSYSWYVPISITEYGGTVRAGVPILVDLGVDSVLVDMDYLDSTGLDSRMRESEYDRPYTLEDSRVGLVVYALTDYQTAIVNLYTGYSPVGTDFDLVVGPSGYVTRADHGDLEFGDAFNIQLRGYIDTTAGSNKNLVFKDSAFKIYISAEGAITASIYNTNWTTTFVTATGVTSGIHKVTVLGDGVNMEIYIDDVEEASIVLVAVPNNGNNWVFMQNRSLVSMEYIRISP